MIAAGREMDRLSIITELEALYRRIPAVDCRRKCQECCGPILCSSEEWRRIRESGRLIRIGDSLNCPLLVDGACSVYAIRPLICRLWGAVKAMRCPFGCRPKRWLSDLEAGKLMERALELSGNKVDGPTVDMAGARIAALRGEAEAAC